MNAKFHTDTDSFYLIILCLSNIMVELVLSQFLPEDGKMEAKLKREGLKGEKSSPLLLLLPGLEPSACTLIISSYWGLKGRSIVSCPRTAVNTWRKQAKVRQQSQAAECFRREKYIPP